MFAESFSSEVPIQTSLRKRKRDSEEPMGDSGRPNKRMRPCDKPQVSEWLEELFNIGAEAVSKLSFDDLVTFDESFFDAETVVLEWEPPLVEIVDTDRCVKVRFANEIPEEVLEAHLRHHASGRKGISPVVRYWCMHVFCFVFNIYIYVGDERTPEPLEFWIIPQHCNLESTIAVIEQL
ncbi:uncharacterized protein LOC126874329 isoform X9 [Bombus huntii]|uniref:uncharacterized protein LOC126874329 isoform X9 n=1 Tax=Bombus huntii TaxID=85661 RepID=UPI0021A9821F|nr:uncharacterized protein LOC126874329 isoform X9 [Bombus huntii]XP_050492199.1 uncharacterized protein LOC126874329 isoform X9 [Bombus huntii]